MRSVRLVPHRAAVVVLLGLVPLVEACLLVSPLDEVSDGTGADDDDVGVGSGGTNAPATGGTGNPGAGGTANAGAGGTSSAGSGGRLETGNGGSIGLSGSGGATGGMGGTTSDPSDVASWCPDPVALFAQNNPYTASFTLIETDCVGDPGLTVLEYNAGVDAAPDCTLMDARFSPDVCGYDEVEICAGVEVVDAMTPTTGDVEAYSRIVQLEPGGPIVGFTELWFTFYDEFGEFILTCSATYDVTYTPQSSQ